VQDNNLATWNAWANSAWPADYLIDKNGQVRFMSVGEGDYTTTEAAIRALLAEAGAKDLGSGVKAHGVIVPSDTLVTAETYLGTARAMGWIQNEPYFGTHTYSAPSYTLAVSDFAYGGTWTIGNQQALAGPGATIEADVQAKNVYIVLSPPATGHGAVAVFVDGRYTTTLNVTKQRLYQLAAFATNSRHSIQLQFSHDTSGYSFTFG
jgi:Thioredoxin like C-terminal domain